MNNGEPFSHVYPDIPYIVNGHTAGVFVFHLRVGLLPNDLINLLELNPRSGFRVAQWAFVHVHASDPCRHLFMIAVLCPVKNVKLCESDQPGYFEI